MVGPVESAGNMVSVGIGGLTNYWWVIAILVILGICGAIAWWFSKYKQKNSQWTHKLFVRIELPNGEIDPNTKTFRMRRWKHKDVATAPLFELEKPLIGSRIFVELEKYTDTTSYTVVLGSDGRLYIPTKTIMSKDGMSLEVSVKHAGIDRARQQYNNRFEQMNASPSKIDGLTLLKYGLWTITLVIVLVLGMTGIKEWGNKASYEASAANAEVRSWEVMAETMDSVESALNTVTLILPDLKELKGNNIAGAINNEKNRLNQSQ